MSDAMQAPAWVLPNPPARIHFVGVGGIGMSGLARILAARGYQVTGSDSVRSATTEDLLADGFAVTIGHHAMTEAANADLVVVTAAVSPGNPEVSAAVRAGRSVVKRAALLGMLARDRICVAVAGSHGKSTTSGMLATALKVLGADPSYAVGAIVRATGSNAEPGNGPHFVVEADEYDYSFLALEPDVAIVTNVDYDHPDLFPDQSAYDAAFLQFVKQVRPGGTLILSHDDPGARRLAAASQESWEMTLTTYGFEEGADWRAVSQGDGFLVLGPSGARADLRIPAPGRHNLLNGLAATAALDALGFGLRDAVDALGRFRGVGRRFEVKGERDGIVVVDDYAHHPEEIVATLQAAREAYPGHRVWAVFQPHTFSRTRALASAFARALADADEIALLDIYAAREADDGTVSSGDIAARLADPTYRFSNPAETAQRLTALLAPGDVVVTMGAGSVTELGPMLLQRLAEEQSC